MPQLTMTFLPEKWATVEEIGVPGVTEGPLESSLILFQISVLRFEIDPQARGDRIHARHALCEAGGRTRR